MSLNYAAIVKLHDQVSGPAKRVGAAVRDMGGQITAVQQKLQAQRAQLDQTMQRAANLTITGAGAMATGRKLSDALRQPTEVAMGFEAAMSKVQALTRLDITNSSDLKHFEKLRQQALKLGEETSFSASQVANAQSFLAMAGFNHEKIEKSMKGMLNLSKAGGTELARTADIASNILSGFGMQAEEMGRLGDVMTYTFTTSNVNLEMLGETMKYVAPVASKAGASVEEVAAMVGMLGDVGIQGSMAGTALRSAFLRLADAPKPAREALKNLGVEAKVGGKFRPMIDILRDLNQEMQGMENGKQIELISTIFGAEAAAGMTELVSNIDKLEGKFQSVSEKADGTAAKVAEIMGKNLLGQIKEMQSATEGLFITLGDRINPQISKLVESKTRLIRKAQNWVKENSKLVTILGSVAVKGAALITIMGGVLMAVGSIIGPLAMLRYGFGSLWVKAGLVTRLFGLFSLATMGGLFALLRWDSALPLVSRHFPKLGKWLGEKLPLSIERFKAGAEAVKRLLNGDKNWDINLPNTEGMFRFRAALEMIRQYLDGNKLKLTRLQLLSQVSQAAFGVDPVKKYGQAMAWLRGVWSQVYSEIMVYLPSLQANASKIMQALGDWFTRNGERIRTAIGMLASAALKRLAGWLERVSASAQNGGLARWLDTIAAKVGPFINAVAGFATGLYKAGQMIASFVVKLKNLVGGWENLGKVFAIGYVLTFFGAFFSVMGSIFTIASSALSVISMLSGFVVWLAKMGVFAKIASAVMLVLRGGFSALAAILPAVGKALLVIGRLALLNPIGLLVTALVGAAYLIYSNWNRIINWWNSSSLKEHMVRIGSTALNYVKAKGQQLFNWWNNTTWSQKALDIATWPLQVAKNIAWDLFNWWLGTKFGQKSLAIATDAVDWAREKVQGFLDWWDGLSLKSITASVQSSLPSWLGGGEEEKKPDGSRALGGPVRAGGLYEVAERGPEIFRTGQRTYLMASKGGNVLPMEQYRQQRDQQRSNPRRIPSPQASMNRMVAEMRGMHELTVNLRAVPGTEAQVEQKRTQGSASKFNLGKQAGAL